MTGTELVAEIADLLEEDHSLNEIWTQAQLHDFVTQNFPLVCERTGGFDVMRSNVVVTAASGATVTLVVRDTMVAPYYVRTISDELPILDIMDTDLLTGVTDPYSRGTPQGCFTEIEHTTAGGVSIYRPVLRFVPRFTAANVTSGISVTYWVKDAPETGQGIGNQIFARDLFILPLKYRCLADALSADTQGHDGQRAQVWQGLSDVLVDSLKALYRGGQVA